MKLSVTFDVRYEAGHSDTETWERDADLFCPHCGEKSVWVEQGGGDYYVGAQHLCLACRWTFHMPALSESHGWQDEQRIAALRRSRKVA